MYVSRTVKCEYCGNQRSTQATAEGLAAQQYDAVLNFETSVVRPSAESRPRLRGSDQLAIGAD